MAREAYNVQADLRDGGSTLLVVVDLTADPRPSGTGKSKLYGSTGFPVRLEHPEIPGLWYSVTVGCDSDEYAEAKQAMAAAKAKFKAFKERQAISNS